MYNYVRTRIHRKGTITQIKISAYNIIYLMYSTCIPHLGSFQGGYIDPPM